MAQTTNPVYIKVNVIIENDGLDFYFILFYFICFYLLLFYFILIFSYLIGNKMKKTKCDTVTGHMTWSHKKEVKGSGTR